MSTAALPVRIAIVDNTGKVPLDELARVTAALGTFLEELRRPWGVAATAVHATPDAGLEDAWPLYLENALNEPGALGYHVDEHRQPKAYVDLEASGQDWPKVVAHEAAEMAVDHTGNRLWTAAAPVDWHEGSKRVRYLVEVADPCEDVVMPVAGIPLTDVVTPAYYRSAARGAGGVGYSLTGAVRAPRTVLDGGYVSWLDPATGEWWQRFVNGGRAEDRSLGTADAEAPSFRAWVDRRTRELGRPA